MNAHRRTLALALTAALSVVAVACGSSTSGRGQLAVSMVDAPNAAFDEIWVRVTRVTAHSSTAGWVTVAKFDEPLPVDLLKLQDAVLPLGLVHLPTGTITQIRLLVAEDGNHVLTGGADFPLKVPSGYQSGIKIHGPWEITACTKTAVTLDFDGKKSIWYHPTGSGDEWILRPVIRVRKAEASSAPCESEPPPAPPAPTSCEMNGDCPEGQLCVAGACASGAGSSCTMGPECYSGTCDASFHCGVGGTGSPCAAALDCLSAVCTANTCRPGPAGAPCAAGADCASGTCDEGACGAGTASGPGQPCSGDVQCLSNACVAGVCDAGGQGTPCTAIEQCQPELACIAGACAPGAL